MAIVLSMDYNVRVMVRSSSSIIDNCYGGPVGISTSDISRDDSEPNIRST